MALDLSLQTQTARLFWIWARFDEFRDLASQKLEPPFVAYGDLSPAAVENRLLLRSFRKIRDSSLGARGWHSMLAKDRVHGVATGAGVIQLRSAINDNQLGEGIRGLPRNPESPTPTGATPKLDGKYPPGQFRAHARRDSWVFKGVRAVVLMG